MQCPNCGKQLPPDTPICPYCMEQEARQRVRKKERGKIYLTVAFCVLILGLIVAAFFVFHPKSEFRRDFDKAESSYVIAALCEESPKEAASAAYQLRLIAAIDDVELHYQNQTCGYAQTINALRQLSLVKNPVVYDHAIEVWENIERLRLFQLFNTQRTDKQLPTFVWNPDIADAAIAVAEEYESVGLEYQINMERLIQTTIPDVQTVSVSNLLNASNAQDALNRYQIDKTPNEAAIDLLSTEDYTQLGIGACYNKATRLWSFFIIAAP